MAKIEKLNAQAFQGRLTQGEKVQLLDVRTKPEFENGHLHSAVNINYFSWHFRKKVKALDMDQPVFLYCQSGKRSGLAIRLLAKLGFKHLIELKGGLNAMK